MNTQLGVRDKPARYSEAHIVDYTPSLLPNYPDPLEEIVNEMYEENQRLQAEKLQCRAKLLAFANSQPFQARTEMLKYFKDELL